jgi:hypothetical protein
LNRHEKKDKLKLLSNRAVRPSASSCREIRRVPCLGHGMRQGFSKVKA